MAVRPHKNSFLDSGSAAKAAHGNSEAFQRIVIHTLIAEGEDLVIKPGRADFRDLIEL